MTGLIKSGSAGLRERVRPLAGFAVAVADPERERLAAELATLAAALSEREEAALLHAEELEAAYAEGREAGRKEAADDGAEALARIEAAAERALALFADELGEMETLAALLARTCLERLLLATEARAVLVRELIAGQAKALDAEAIVRVSVSAADFPRAEGLEAVAASLGSRRCEIIAADELDSGDCRIALRLGTLEIGLGQQWGRLRAVLDDAIGAEAEI
ncbi:MAG TPA: hypothetical protein VGW40_14965 [Allosphingosinicella sp.]|nr:hypothetical protein [Allosphingosinicella sp.]